MPSCTDQPSPPDSCPPAGTPTDDSLAAWETLDRQWDSIERLLKPLCASFLRASQPPEQVKRLARAVRQLQRLSQHTVRAVQDASHPGAAGTAPAQVPAPAADLTHDVRPPAKRSSHSHPPARTRLSLLAEGAPADASGSHCRLHGDAPQFSSLADAVLQSSNDAILLLRDCRAVECNEVACRMFGLTRDQLLGSCPLAELGPAGDCGETFHDAAMEACREARELGASRRELQFRGGDGSALWCEALFSAIHVDQHPHILVMIHDVSPRKELELRLQRSRDFLLNIINAVPDHIVVKSDNHELVLVNDAYCRTHHVAREDLLGNTESSLLSTEMAEKLLEVEDRLLDHGGTLDQERVEQLADGRRIIYATKHSRYEDEVSGDRFVVSTSRNITADRAKEQRLHLLASVFNNANEGVAIIDTHGMICEANPAFLQLSDREVGELHGIALEQTLDWEIDDYHAILANVSRGAPWAGKVKVRTRTGVRSYWVSFSPVESGQPIRQIIAMFSDVTEIARTQQRLRRQALHDNVTGLPNRLYCREHITQCMQRADANRSGVGLLFLDLDDFKSVNDSLGHTAGDQLLVSVTNRVTRALPQHCFMARFGGDEFAVVVDQIVPQGNSVGDVTHRILESLRMPFQIGGTEIFLSVSIGSARYPEDGSKVDELLGRADLAMYAAKEAGKNQVRHFCPSMQTNVDLRHQLQNELRGALGENQITVVYQPMLDARTYDICGCEALIRWQRGDGQYISPAQFIPVAEETGLIIPLGEFVLREACRFFQSLEVSADFRISVNLSPRQLHDRELIRRVDEILADTGMPASRLELEITENAVMEDVQLAIQLMDELAMRGIALAVDDFGTGYSSLSYLKRFKLSKLKIDRMFVKDLPDDESALAIAKAIVSLGKGRDLTIVAEGVETRAQFECLSQIGVDTMQGFLISRPLPANEFCRFLESAQSPVAAMSETTQLLLETYGFTAPANAPAD